MKKLTISQIRNLVELVNEQHLNEPPIFKFHNQLSDLQREVINKHLIWALNQLEEVSKWMDGKTVDVNLFQKWKKEVFDG